MHIVPQIYLNVIVARNIRTYLPFLICILIYDCNSEKPQRSARTRTVPLCKHCHTTNCFIIWCTSNYSHKLVIAISNFYKLKKTMVQILAKSSTRIRNLFFSQSDFISIKFRIYTFFVQKIYNVTHFYFLSTTIKIFEKTCETHNVRLKKVASENPFFFGDEK